MPTGGIENPCKGGVVHRNAFRDKPPDVISRQVRPHGDLGAGKQRMQAIGIAQVMKPLATAQNDTELTVGIRPLDDGAGEILRVRLWRVLKPGDDPTPASR